jgi:DNA polymerase IV
LSDRCSNCQCLSRLTASAGVAPNKFLAKIASDWKKPVGLFVIQSHQIHDFLRDLPIGRIPGVGKVTEQQLLDAGIKTIGDVQAMDAETLEARFSRYGLRLYELARGIDHSPIVPNRVRKSISAEDTFSEDIPLTGNRVCEIRRLAEKVWAASRENARGARTAVLKLKTKEFSTLTRSLTPTEMPGSAESLAAVALSLFDRVELGADQLFRLVGVGLSNFQSSEERPLFSSEDEASDGGGLANLPVS